MKHRPLNRIGRMTATVASMAIFALWGAGSAMAAGDDGKPRLDVGSGGSSDAIRSIDHGNSKGAETIHPWDNNDFGDSTEIESPGGNRRRPPKEIPDPPTHKELLDGGEVGKQSGVRPEKVALLRNYPNPFNAQTRIEFSLGKAGAVSLEIYNLLGQVVQSVTWTHLEAGTHSYVWSGQSEDGREVPSGVYFYRLEASQSSAVNKMVLLK